MSDMGEKKKSEIRDAKLVECFAYHLPRFEFYVP